MLSLAEALAVLVIACISQEFWGWPAFLSVVAAALVVDDFTS